MRPPRPPTTPTATASPSRVSVEVGASGEGDAQPALVHTPASESSVADPAKFDDTTCTAKGVVADATDSNDTRSRRKRGIAKKQYKKKSAGDGRKQGRSRPPTALERKAEEIEAVLAADDVDLWRLRELALTEGGLINGAFVLLTYR
jgi:hypothetical protein